MKKYLLVLTLFIPLNLRSQSQAGWQWGFGAGTTVYFGDLGNEQYIPLTGTHYGCSFSVRHDLKAGRNPISGNAPFAIVARFDWLRIGYDETHPLVFNTQSGLNLRNFRRGLNFRNDLIGINMQFTYTIHLQEIFPLWQHRFALYFFIGPGIYYSDPHADLFRGDININNRYYYWHDGTLRDAPESSGHGNEVQRDGKYETRLRNWYTEGESPTPQPGRKTQYSQFQPGFPHGGGIKYGISRKITFQWELCFYDFPFTDFLDDASHRYATFAEIESNFPNDPQKQTIAKYVTDPSGLGSDGENGKASSPRGNPKKFDWINYMNFQLFFTPTTHAKSYHAKHGHRKSCPTF